MAAKKKAAKKASAKRSVKKSVKKSSAKKSVRKSAKRSARSSTRYSIPAVPVSGSSRSSISSISTTPRPAASARTPSVSRSSGSGSSKAVVIAVVVGILILAVAVISQNSSSESTTVTPIPVASESNTPTEQPTTEPGETPITAYEAPVGIVSIYNETGAMVNWKAPAASAGITGYNVELRDNGVGDWRLVATVPASEFKQQITKNDTSGWVQVKVSTVYADGEITEGKVHGLPGSWS